MSDPQVIIREDDASAYRVLRSRTLEEHPTALVSSYEEQKDWPPGTFAQRLRRSFDSAVSKA